MNNKNVMVVSFIFIMLFLSSNILAKPFDFLAPKKKAMKEPVETMTQAKKERAVSCASLPKEYEGGEIDVYVNRVCFSLRGLSHPGTAQVIGYHHGDYDTDVSAEWRVIPARLHMLMGYIQVKNEGEGEDARYLENTWEDSYGLDVLIEPYIGDKVISKSYNVCTPIAIPTEDTIRYGRIEFDYMNPHVTHKLVGRRGIVTGIEKGARITINPENKIRETEAGRQNNTITCTSFYRAPDRADVSERCVVLKEEYLGEAPSRGYYGPCPYAHNIFYSSNGNELEPRE